MRPEEIEDRVILTLKKLAAKKASKQGGELTPLQQEFYCQWINDIRTHQQRELFKRDVFMCTMPRWAG